ncbi:YafY family protein [Saccharibacillus sp. JS10]|uniref:helix-turn-helix transcriptional regulator n=1 Tax=Saccharibacillus sp. JS10 TaxID=2950552 RepID=UPI00210B3F9C|nr:YafY family protein [Saccharibacillus sp. JS10]MCQ4087934.1 YafY family transcriptional regulator [Saccharibacillus sp. JS10]
MKIDRLLAITILLLNRQRVNAAELSSRFEVSTKTIYRDIETLSRAGIPIVSYPGIGGGFELMERYTIGRQLLSPSEIQALRAAVQGAASVIDDQTFTDLTDKVQALLGGASETRLPGVVFDLNTWSGIASVRDRVECLRQAARNAIRVEVRYLNMNGQESRRILEPAMLLMKSGIWYLQAYCLLRGEFRMFRLSRMLELAETGEPFVPKIAPAIDTEEWSGDWRRNPRSEVTLHFNKNVRLRVTDEFESSMITELEDRSVRVQGEFAPDSWFYGMLLSYGDEVKVESPNFIAQELMNRAKKIVERYTESLLNVDIGVSAL